VVAWQCWLVEPPPGGFRLRVVCELVQCSPENAFALLRNCFPGATYIYWQHKQLPSNADIVPSCMIPPAQADLPVPYSWTPPYSSPEPPKICAVQPNARPPIYMPCLLPHLFSLVCWSPRPAPTAAYTCMQPPAWAPAPPHHSARRHSACADQLPPADVDRAAFNAFWTQRGFTLEEGLALVQGSHSLVSIQACFR
jgi:hypothetical protein